MVGTILTLIVIPIQFLHNQAIDTIGFPANLQDRT